jgi:hypothetical protein
MFIFLKINTLNCNTNKKTVNLLKNIVQIYFFALFKNYY